MEIPQNLQQKLTPTALAGWMRYDVKVPASHFLRYISQQHGIVFLFTTINGCVNSEQWPLLCNKIDSFKPDDIKGQFRKFQTGELPGNFDSLILLPPTHHKSHKEFSQELHDKTYIVIPIFKCEFSDSETPVTVDVLRGFDPLNDWGRSPSPKIQMEYRIDSTGERSKNFGFISFRSTKAALSNLQDSDSGFVKLVNYKGGIFHAVKVHSGFSGQNELTNKLLADHPFNDAVSKFVHGDA